MNYHSDSQIGCTTILYIINYVFLCSQIVDEAAKKIAELLKRSHEQHTGINLEVNSRILDSCTDLMQSIQMLIQRSIDLQREIVTQVWYGIVGYCKSVIIICQHVICCINENSITP